MFDSLNSPWGDRCWELDYIPASNYNAWRRSGVFIVNFKISIGNFGQANAGWDVFLCKFRKSDPCQTNYNLLTRSVRISWEIT